MLQVYPSVQLIGYTQKVCMPGTEDEPLEPYSGKGGAESLVEFAGRACYQSFDKPNPATAETKDYLANILRQKHYSVLEHASATFYITGVSRSFTHELVRHRHFSFSELSQRYVDVENMGVVIPPALKSSSELVDELACSIEGAVEGYRMVVDDLHMSGELSKKQIREAARAHLPNCTETRIVVTGNWRAWIEFLVKRDNPAADAEMQNVARMIGGELAHIAPNVFGDEARALWDESVKQRAARF